MFFKPDRHFLDSMIDLDNRLEEQTISIQGEKFKAMRHEMLESQIMLRDKVKEVELQMIKANKKQQYNNFRKTQEQLYNSGNNVKQVNSHIFQQLHRAEDKLHEFRLIRQRTRSYAKNLEDIISFIEENMKDQ